MTWKSRSCRIGGAAVGLMLILTGCTDTSPVPEPTRTATTAPTPTDTVSPEGLDDGVKVAEQAMSAFANHNRSYDEWWAELSPLLTTDAQLAYEDTNPARVRPSQVTGAGVVASAPNFNQMSVLVPTDIGQYTIELLRQGDDNPNGTPSWYVDRITPPEDLG